MLGEQERKDLLTILFDSNRHRISYSAWIDQICEVFAPHLRGEFPGKKVWEKIKECQGLNDVDKVGLLFHFRCFWNAEALQNGESEQQGCDICEGSYLKKECNHNSWPKCGCFLKPCSCRTPEPCGTCGGSGEVTGEAPDGSIQPVADCPACKSHHKPEADMYYRGKFGSDDPGTGYVKNERTSDEKRKGKETYGRLWPNKEGESPIVDLYHLSSWAGNIFQVDRRENVRRK